MPTIRVALTQPPSPLIAGSTIEQLPASSARVRCPPACSVATVSKTIAAPHAPTSTAAAPGRGVQGVREGEETP